MQHTIAGFTFALLLVAGCGGKGGEGEGSSGGGETDETLGNSSAPGDTSGETGSTGVEPTGGFVSITATENGETAGATNVTVAESGESGEAPGPCGTMCEHAGECGLVEDVGACVAVCAGTLEESLPACAAANAAYLQCTGELTCEQLADSLAGGFSHPCNSEQLERDAACDPQADCDWGAGGDLEGKDCLLSITCPGEPEREMKCDMETCKCLEDGREVGSCPAEDVCLDIGQIQDKGPGCCGFPEVDP